ncbi:MAG: hypothetical protein ABI689_18265 [Thermoanaerobaculia bacterium]
MHAGSLYAPARAYGFVERLQSLGLCGSQSVGLTESAIDGAVVLDLRPDAPSHALRDEALIRNILHVM